VANNKNNTKKESNNLDKTTDKSKIAKSANYSSKNKNINDKVKNGN